MENRRGIAGRGSNVPPLWQHVEIYFSEKGCPKERAIMFFLYFENRGWQNGKGSHLRNWKAAAWEWIIKKRTFS